eukprot:CAMPEP_0172423188 /NCGR_PEP_ID=MMETSP1064-20121228/14404_1 /TAXON_ID=202472 /ORGANISM="Aulacoseira subarctica , Strain CCAP 1002/5" /LENGTH=95 /DNA_ID=CAMNT_0013164419 /DNA_START=36 /DNA_END=323 /DNA_ORIENTATION=-
MLRTRVTTLATRMVTHRQQQRRGFFDYLTNYPDKVMEKKAIQMKGGVCLGAENPTWLKQSSDKMVSYFALFIAATGLTLAVRGHYHMAYGIGKKE